MPTAVIRTRLVPGPASGTGSSPTRRSPTPNSLAARTRPPPPMSVLSLFFIPNGPWFPLTAPCESPVVRSQSSPGYPRPYFDHPRNGGAPCPGRRGTGRRARLALGCGTGNQRHGRGVRLPAGVHPADRDRVAGVMGDERLGDVLAGGDRLAADRGDLVARGQAGARGGGPGHGSGDGHA